MTISWGLFETNTFRFTELAAWMTENVKPL